MQLMSGPCRENLWVGEDQTHSSFRGFPYMEYDTKERGTSGALVMLVHDRKEQGPKLNLKLLFSVENTSHQTR